MNSGVQYSQAVVKRAVIVGEVVFPRRYAGGLLDEVCMVCCGHLFARRYADDGV